MAGAAAGMRGTTNTQQPDIILNKDGGAGHVGAGGPAQQQLGMMTQRQQPTKHLVETAGRQ